LHIVIKRGGKTFYFLRGLYAAIGNPLKVLKGDPPRRKIRLKKKGGKVTPLPRTI